MRFDPIPALGFLMIGLMVFYFLMTGEMIWN